MRWLFVIGLVSGCASSTPAREVSSQQQTIETEPIETPQVAETPRFVVISKNTPLYLAPSEDAPRLIFRSHEEQKKLEAKWQSEIQEWAVKTQTKFAKEMETEKKRMRKMKSSDARDEYAHKRRASRAARYIKDIDRRAKRINESPQSRFIVLQKVQQQGDWLEVLTLNGEEESRFCYENGLPGLRAAKLRGWVKASSIERVTTERQRYPVWRGSEVKLAAGVVVEEHQGDFVAHVDGFKVRLSMDDKSIADEFTPGPLFEAPYTASVFSEIALAEGHLQLSKDQTLPYNPFADLYVTETLWVDSTFFATTQTPCAEFTVHAEESLLVPAGKRRAMRLDGGTMSAAPPFAKRGSKLYDASGTEIGMASFDVSLGTPIEVDNQGRQCFEKLVWTPARKQKVPDDWRLIWCVPPEDVSNQ